MNARHLNILGAGSLALSDELGRATSDAAAGHGGGMPAALASLAYGAGHSMELLAATLGLSQSGAVRLVDRMVSEALATRTRHGRRVAIELTPAGQAVAREVLEARARVISTFTTHLSGPERRDLARLMEKMLTGIDFDDAKAEFICRLCDEAYCPSQQCPVRPWRDGEQAP